MGNKIVKDLTPQVLWHPVVKEIDEEMGTVGAELSVTNNLGNYNSVKIGMIYRDDVQDGETVEEAWDRIYRKVEKLVEDALDEYSAD